MPKAGNIVSKTPLLHAIVTIVSKYRFPKTFIVLSHYISISYWVLGQNAIIRNIKKNKLPPNVEYKI